MTTMGLLLAWLGVAQATEIVAVDRGTWLHTGANEASRRVRPVPAEGAPEHVPPPVTLLEKVGTTRNGWVHVRPLTMVSGTRRDGSLAAPSKVPPSWPHCYAAPVGFGQMVVDLYVRPSDLLPVLTRTVTSTAADGTTVTLQPGLAATGGKDGRYRIPAAHLTLAVSIPDDALSDSYDPETVPTQLDVSWIAGSGDARFRLAEDWGARISTLREGTVAPRGVAPLDDEGPEVSVIEDRCARVELATPIRGLPEREPRSADDLLRWPVVVPEQAPVRWEDGTPLGLLAEGGFVLWNRKACVADDEQTCCTPPAGLATADASDAPVGVCFGAKLPTMRVSPSLRDVYRHQQSQMEARAKALAEGLAVTGVVDITWTEPDVVGPIAPKDVDLTLLGDLSMLRYCYARALVRDPTLGGRIALQFGLSGDGRAVGARVVEDDVGVDKVGECFVNRADQWIVLNQIGQDPSTVRVDFMLLPPARDEDDAPLTTEADDEARAPVGSEADRAGE